MLVAYFDETGTHGPAEVTTLAGWVAPAKVWRRIERKWATALAGFGVSEFKASALAARQGEYEGWDVDRTDAFLARLADIVSKRVVLGVSASVVLADYRKYVTDVLPRRVLFRDPYSWCLQSCMERIAEASQIPRHKNIAIVLDEGHPRLESVMRFFRARKIRRPSVFRRFVSIAAADSVRVNQIQTADMLAWEIVQHQQQLVVHGKMNQRAQMTRLRRAPMRAVYYNRGNLEPVASLLAAQTAARRRR